MRWLVGVLVVVAVMFPLLLNCHPLSGGLNIDPVQQQESTTSATFIRTKRNGDSSMLDPNYVPGKSVIVMVKRRQRNSQRSPADETYRVTRKLELEHPHPYRKKVKPVEKPITPYFVRILRRRPVGPSAMNYTAKEESSFENSDNGEIIDVPRVLVDKRRNKNVDIHPIYVVDDDDEEKKTGDKEATPDESVVFVPTISSSTSTTTTSTTTSTTTTPPPPPPVIPIVRFTRVQEETEPTTTVKPDVDYDNRGIEAVRNRLIKQQQVHRDEPVTEYMGQLSIREESNHHTDQPHLTHQNYDHEDLDDEDEDDEHLPTTVTTPHYPDYLPLDYDYGNSTGDVVGQVQQDHEEVHQREQTRYVSQQFLTTTGAPTTVQASPTTTTTVPTTTTETPTELPLEEEVEPAHLPSPSSLVVDPSEAPQDHDGPTLPSKKRVLQSPPETVVLTRVPPPTPAAEESKNAGLAGDFGYGGVVIGGGELTITTSTTTTSTPAPTTTSTTTTTTTTTPEPTTTSTTTTTTPAPTTTSTTTTTTTTPEPLPSTDDLLLLQLLSNLQNATEEPPRSSAAVDDATTLAQLQLLTQLLSQNPTTTPPITTPPPHRYTQVFDQHAPQDLQTAASTVPQLFSTRGDIRTTTTKNPLLSFLDTLTGNAQQQQSRSTGQQITQSQEQVVSFVRPIQESKQDQTQGSDIGGSLLKMLVQLPGNLLVGVIRFMRSTGEFLGGLMNGLMRMLGGLGGGGSSSSGGGLFGG